MFCTNCGKQISDSSEFCEYCGNKIEKNEEVQKCLKVVFSRPKKIIGCAVPMRVYIDGTLVATLANGASSEVDVIAGKHKVVVEMWSAISENEVDFPAEYPKMYIDVGIKMGLITNKALITAIRH